MRILFANTSHCANLAKALKREAKPHVPTVSLAMCQTAVAMMMGYRNWPELSAHARPGVVESPSDDMVPAQEASFRALMQAKAVHDRLGVPHAVARDIVARIRPTGRRAPAARPAWRDRLQAVMARPGMPGMDGEYAARLLETATGRCEVHGPAWKVRKAGGLGEILVDVRSEESREENFRFDVLRAVRVVDGRIVMSMDGYVVAPTADGREECHLCWTLTEEGGDDDELDSIVEETGDALSFAADEVENDITDAILALNRGGHSFRMLMRGPMLVLTDVQRDPSATSKGQGAEFLAAVMAAYNARRRGTIRSVASAFEPEGYDELERPERNADWRTARSHLAAWLDASPAVRAVLGREGEVFAYGPNGSIA